MSFIKINFPESYNNIVRRVKIDKKIASIIILYKKSCNERDENLFFTLNWIEKYFMNFFEIIVVEQDVEQKLFIEDRYNFVKYYFLYNDQQFNRGWGFNCAVKHFSTTDIVALIDSDLILHRSFFESILSVYRNKYDIVSPYDSIYYTTQTQKKNIISNIYTTKIKQNILNKKTKVTISGGILIIKKSTYLELGGFEEYKDYGAEDSAFDINIMYLKKNRIFINKEQYIHLYHPPVEYKDEIIIEHYNKYYVNNININNYENILLSMNNHRSKYIGDINLYKNFNNYINSIPDYDNQLLE